MMIWSCAVAGSLHDENSTWYVLLRAAMMSLAASRLPTLSSSKVTSLPDGSRILENGSPPTDWSTWRRRSLPLVAL
jgi:hypothetical protein